MEASPKNMFVIFMCLYLTVVINNANGQFLLRGVPLPTPRNTPVSPNQGQEEAVSAAESWLNGVDDTVVIGIDGKKLDVPPYKTALLGGIRKIKDPSKDQSVQRLLHLGTVKDRIQNETRSSNLLKLNRIVSAHRQIVSGQITYLQLVMAETVCPKAVINAAACDIDPTEELHFCHVAVWERQWLNSTKFIEESTRCAEMEDDNDFKAWGHAKNKYSNDPLSYEVILDILPEGLDENQVAVEAFNYIEKGSESQFKGRLISHDIEAIKFDPQHNLTRITVKVEFGFGLCLKLPPNANGPQQCDPDYDRDSYLCSVTLVDDPSGLMRLHVIPDDGDDINCKRKRRTPVDEELIVPVQAPCLGCMEAVPLNDPLILEIANFALTEYDRMDDDENLHKIVRIHKAHSQVVAGIKYHLTLEVAETDCQKALMGSEINRTLCNEDTTEENDICEMQILDQPWVPVRSLAYVRCYDAHKYPDIHKDELIIPVAAGVIGSATPSTAVALDTNEGSNFAPDVIDAAEFVLSAYNKHEVELDDDLDDGYFKLIRVLEASTENVGGGIQHTLSVELGETTCLRFQGPPLSFENCTVKQWEEHEVCEAVVLEQPQLQQAEYRTLLSLHCSDLDDYLVKKSLPAITGFNVVRRPFLESTPVVSHAGNTSTPILNDTRVQEAASFVVTQYNLQEDDEDLFILQKIVSAHPQGNPVTSYILELEMAETLCRKYLPVADPHQCPIVYSEEPEMCQAEVILTNEPSVFKLGRLYCDDREDYYKKQFAEKHSLNSGTTHSSGKNIWQKLDTKDAAMQNLAKAVADEYDTRSDEDNLYVLYKLLEANQQVNDSLIYLIKAELAETFCPKYKRNINKTLCKIDITEEHKICDAVVKKQPWLNKYSVMKLQCVDSDDLFDESKEILYPKVHPSAHMRPVFYTKFQGSGSDESRENQKYYHSSESKYSSDEGGHDDDDDDNDDSDEFLRRG